MGTVAASQTTLHSSNDILFNWVEESSPNVASSSAKWQRLTATAFGAFGGTLGSVEAEDLEPSAQNLEPSIVSEDSAADFTANLRYSNITRFMEGLIRNNYVERGSNRKFYPPTSAIPTITGVAADGYIGTNLTAANGFTLPTGGNLVVFATGFRTPANNGRKFVSEVAAGGTKLTVTGLTADAGDTGGTIEVIGFRGKAADISVEINTDKSIKSVTSKAVIPDALLPAIGEWVQIIDVTAHPNDSVLGWVRISAVDEDKKIFSVNGATFTLQSAETGAGKTFEIVLASKSVTNPDEGKIIDRTYQFERVLAQTPTVEVQRVCGATTNTLALAIPTRGKATANFGYIGSQVVNSNTIVSGTPIPAKSESLFNTSDDIPFIAVFNSKRERLFTSLSDITINVDNGVTGVPAVGTRSFVGTIHGNFGLTISATAIFGNVKAMQAAIDNETVSIVMILKNRNGGFVIDIPAVKINTADAVLALGTQINLTLATTAFKGVDGYTMRWSVHPYIG